MFNKIRIYAREVADPWFVFHQQFVHDYQEVFDLLKSPLLHLDFRHFYQSVIVNLDLCLLIFS